MLALAIPGFLGIALRVPHAVSWVPPETPWPGNPESNVVAIPLVRTNLLIPLFASGPQHQFEIPSIPHPTHPRRPASPGQLPAGVCKTAPYACIVVVPGPHRDDRAIVSPSSRDYRMQIIRPDLQFIPLSSASK